MFEGAQSVIAVSVDGFAQISLESFKASSIITLQQWGRVEGTLQINHHAGSNETVVLQPVMRPYQIRPKSTNEVEVSHAYARNSLMLNSMLSGQKRTSTGTTPYLSSRPIQSPWLAPSARAIILRSIALGHHRCKSR